MYMYVSVYFLSTKINVDLVVGKSVTPSSEKQCFVCEAPVVAVFKPCGHALMCRECAERVNKCPDCKVIIEPIVYENREGIHAYVYCTCTFFILPYLGAGAKCENS